MVVAALCRRLATDTIRGGRRADGAHLVGGRRLAVGVKVGGRAAMGAQVRGETRRGRGGLMVCAALVVLRAQGRDALKSGETTDTVGTLGLEAVCGGVVVMAATAKRLERMRMTSVAVLDGCCGEGRERGGGAGGSAT